jgi:hypothetical protein
MKPTIRKLAAKPATGKPAMRKPSTTTAKTATKTDAKPKAAFDRGSAGFAKGQQKREAQEADYQKRKDTPFVFKLKPGDEAEVILLDKGDPYFVTLHKVKNAAGKWVDEVCIADSGQRCPICESTGKDGSYTMVATILDRRPYKTRDGKTVKASKKLLFVKGRNMPKFDRKWKGDAKGNFRGLKLTCRRDTDKETSMGEDIEWGGRVSEEFLSKYGEITKPADYAKIFAMPTAAELRKRYKLAKGSVVGEEEFPSDDEDDDSGDVKWGGDDE